MEWFARRLDVEQHLESFMTFVRANTTKAVKPLVAISEGGERASGGGSWSFFGDLLRENGRPLKNNPSLQGGRPFSTKAGKKTPLVGGGGVFEGLGAPRSIWRLKIRRAVAEWLRTGAKMTPAVWSHILTQARNRWATSACKVAGSLSMESLESKSVIYRPHPDCFKLTKSECRNQQCSRSLLELFVSFALDLFVAWTFSGFRGARLPQEALPGPVQSAHGAVDLLRPVRSTAEIRGQEVRALRAR